MKVYYNGNYKIIDNLGNEIIYNKLEDIPNYKTEITEVEITEGTTKINDKAFYNCKNLEKIEIPDSVTKIGNSAFFLCESLKEIKIPNNVNEIGEYAFSGCISLESINIPKTIQYIKKATFHGCHKLESITLPNVNKIEDMAFENCSSLKEVIIPDGPRARIDECTFDKDPELYFVSYSEKILDTLSDKEFRRMCCTLLDVEYNESMDDSYTIEETEDGDFIIHGDYIDINKIIQTLTLEGDLELAKKLNSMLNELENSNSKDFEIEYNQEDIR
jgi:hypothetical protein